MSDTDRHTHTQTHSHTDTDGQTHTHTHRHRHEHKTPRSMKRQWQRPPISQKNRRDPLLESRKSTESHPHTHSDGDGESRDIYKKPHGARQRNTKINMELLSILCYRWMVSKVKVMKVIIILVMGRG